MERIEQRTWLRLFFFGEKPDSSCSTGPLLSWYQEISLKMSKSSALLQSLSFFLQWKSDDSIKHYLNQMLLLPTYAIDKREKFTYTYGGLR